MKSLIDIVKEKIKKNIPDSNIEIIDNTHLHKHHKSFNKSKTHLKIIIQSDTLRNLNRIDSHKKITSILRDEIQTKIHSLEIKIMRPQFFDNIDGRICFESLTPLIKFTWKGILNKKELRRNVEPIPCQFPPPTICFGHGGN